jgi:hypothetical protein
MRDLLVLLVHFLTTLARLLGPGGKRAVIVDIADQTSVGDLESLSAKGNRLGRPGDRKGDLPSHPIIHEIGKNEPNPVRKPPRIACLQHNCLSILEECASS